MQRRDFLSGMLGLGMVAIGSSAWALRTPVPTQRKLIVIMLRGAVDGLSVVVPYADNNYYQLRDSIAIPRPNIAEGVWDLDGYFGLHPALSALQPLWQQKKLAFVHASGSRDPTRSHFDAQDYMESGTPGRKSTADGWMNRLLAILPGATTPTRGMSLGTVMPRIFMGSAPVGNMAAGAGALRQTALDRPQVNSAFAQLYQGNSKLAQLYQESQDTRQEVMGAMDKEMTAANGGAALPNGFPQDAARLARLMRNDSNVQLVFMDLGGWDTHINQGAAQGQLANHLQPLGQGLANLAQSLGDLFDDTTIVVMSEFGRTAKQNGNNGTDHGHGNVMWLLGGRVNGGHVAGDWQGLDEAHLHEQRDLPVTTDFRAVLSQVAERHLQLSDVQLQKVFPDMGQINGHLQLIV